MLETLLTTFGFVFVNLFAISAILIFAILSESNDSVGWSFFWSVFAGVLVFLYLKLNIADIVWYIVGYLGIGIIWTFFRYKRFLVAEISKIKSFSNDVLYFQQQVVMLKPDNMLTTITHWAIIWPVSMIANLTGDTIDAIKTMIGTAFKSIYKRIYNSVVPEEI